MFGITEYLHLKPTYLVDKSSALSGSHRYSDPPGPSPGAHSTHCIPGCNSSPGRLFALSEGYKNKLSPQGCFGADSTHRNQWCSSLLHTLFALSEGCMSKQPLQGCSGVDNIHCTEGCSSSGHTFSALFGGYRCTLLPRGRFVAHSRRYTGVSSD